MSMFSGVKVATLCLFDFDKVTMVLRQVSLKKATPYYLTLVNL